MSNLTYFFEMDTDIELMALSRRDGNSVYQVYAAYKEPWRPYEIGKMLITNLGANAQFTKVYDFTDSNSRVGEAQIARKIYAIGTIDDHFVYAGS